MRNLPLGRRGRGSDSEMRGQGGRLEAKGALKLMASVFSVTSEV